MARWKRRRWVRREDGLNVAHFLDWMLLHLWVAFGVALVVGITLSAFCFVVFEAVLVFGGLFGKITLVQFINHYGYWICGGAALFPTSSLWLLLAYAAFKQRRG